MKARLMNVTAMVAFGTIAVFVRSIGLSSFEIAFWRGAIAFAVLLLLRLPARRARASIRRRQKLLLLVSGMAIGLNWVLLFMAYDHTSVAVATLAYYFAPVLVMAFSPLLFRERITRAQVLCFLAATAGLVLVVAGGGAELGGSRGVLYGLGAACLYACVVLLNKFLTDGTGLDRTIWQFAGASALLLAVLLAGGGFQIHRSDSTSLWNLLTVGVVHTGLCYWLYFASLRELPGQQAAILSYVDPLVAILVSVALLRETIAPLQWLGAVLILGFTCLSQFQRAKPKA